jgi:ABC-type arginine transport system ATPase subunit
VNNRDVPCVQGPRSLHTFVCLLGYEQALDADTFVCEVSDMVAVLKPSGAGQ